MGNGPVILEVQPPFVGPPKDSFRCRCSLALYDPWAAPSKISQNIEIFLGI
jgi:hypothetical protein